MSWSKKYKIQKNKFEQWVKNTARHKAAVWWLGILSWTEAVFFPIPPEVLLLPMVAVQPKKWFKLSALTAATSLLGAVAGYIIGAWLFDSVGQWLFENYGFQDQFMQVETYFKQAVFLTMLTSAFTPIPFKVFTLAGGFFNIAFIPFILGSIIGRSARFMLEGYLLFRYGEKLMRTAFRYAEWTAVLVAAGVLFLIFH